MVLGRLQWECILMHVDDVNVYSRGFAAHVNDLHNIFTCICIAGLKLKAKKCKIGLSELVYLRHVVFVAGLRPNPNKIHAASSFPRPTNLKCVQSFIDLVNHYQRFICDSVTIAAPMYRLMKKHVLLTWVAMEQMVRPPQVGPVLRSSAGLSRFLEIIHSPDERLERCNRCYTQPEHRGSRTGSCVCF